MGTAMLELATGGRTPSFEYCANKQQATEATSENCWIFLGFKTNYPTNKQSNKQTVPASTLSKKHNSICYHKVRESVASDWISIAWIKSQDNLADLFRKVCQE